MSFFIFYVMISVFFSLNFDCFAFVKKFCHDYSQVFKFSVILAENCDHPKHVLELCKYHKKQQITKNVMSKKLHSKTKSYNIQMTINTTIVIFVKFKFIKNVSKVPPKIYEQHVVSFIQCFARYLH